MIYACFQVNLRALFSALVDRLSSFFRIGESYTSPLSTFSLSILNAYSRKLSAHGFYGTGLHSAVVGIWLLYKYYFRLSVESFAQKSCSRGDVKFKFYW